MAGRVNRVPDFGADNARESHAENDDAGIQRKLASFDLSLQREKGGDKRRPHQQTKCADGQRANVNEGIQGLSINGDKAAISS